MFEVETAATQARPFEQKLILFRGNSCNVKMCMQLQLEVSNVKVLDR